MIACDWCRSNGAIVSHNTVYWELPDGTRAITLRETPCVECNHCGLQYQSEEIIKAIEDQLFLIDVTKMPNELSYQELMTKPRLLKRNYFDFS